MTTFLDRIVADKVKETARLLPPERLEEFRNRMAKHSPARSLKAAMEQGPAPAIIAEIKKASPSKGLLAPHLDHRALALEYQANGAAALSVLTERTYFLGDPEFITQVRPLLNLPILRKDFILEAIQVYESAAIGADALLLIVAILTDEQLGALLALTRQLGLEALVEVHTKAELHRALEAGATLIGVNHRNLQTFELDMNRALDLAPLMPAGVTLVAASGLHGREDLARLEKGGIKAFLIGESLVKAASPGAKLRELRGLAA